MPSLFTGSGSTFFNRVAASRRTKVELEHAEGRAKIRCHRAVKRRLETRRISSFNFAGTIQFPGSAAKKRLDISLLFFTKPSAFFSPYIHVVSE